MSGGNQRELARAKNLKKQQDQAKKKGAGESGVALKERKERFVKFTQDPQQNEYVHQYNLRFVSFSFR